MMQVNMVLYFLLGLGIWLILREDYTQWVQASQARQATQINHILFMALCVIGWPLVLIFITRGMPDE